MKKLLLTFVIALMGVCVFAQQDTTKKNNQPKQIQPDMQKDTVVLFLGHFGGPMKAVDLQKGDSLWVNKGGLQIVQFSLVYRQDTAFKKLDAMNYKLTPEMKTALKNLKEGQNFQFVNIRIQAKDGVTRKPTYDSIDMFIEKTQ
ncbi:MAG: hypothetical protein V1904_12720 [Bacteroidota bacterium]